MRHNQVIQEIFDSAYNEALKRYEQAREEFEPDFVDSIPGERTHSPLESEPGLRVVGLTVELESLTGSRFTVEFPNVRSSVVIHEESRDLTKHHPEQLVIVREVELQHMIHLEFASSKIPVLASEDGTFYVLRVPETS